MPIKTCITKLEKNIFPKYFGVINFRTKRKKLYFRRYKLSDTLRPKVCFAETLHRLVYTAAKINVKSIRGCSYEKNQPGKTGCLGLFSGDPAKTGPGWPG